MPHLLKEYEKNLGVDADKPFVNEHYFPTYFDKYIVIYCEESLGKHYVNYDLVIQLLTPFLQRDGIKVVCLGHGGSPPSHCDLLIKELSFRQNCYLVSRSLALISADNIISQYASSVGVPVVNLFSDNFPSITKCFWSKENKNVVNIMPKWECKPYYVGGDRELSINNIPAEKIANGVIGLLSNWSSKKTKFKTKTTNKKYKLKIDVVPTSFVQKPFFDNVNETINIRLDLLDDANDYIEHIAQYLSHYKCNLILKNSFINNSLLYKFKQNINSIEVRLDEIPPDPDDNFFNHIKLMKIDLCFVVENESILNDVRFKFFDQKVFFEEKTHSKPKNIKKTDSFFSARYVFEGDKNYHSFAHWQKGLDNNTNIIDNETFWEELDYFYIYED